MRVLRGENDKHDEQRDEHTGGGVQPGATGPAGKPARRGSREEAEPGAAADASGADPSSAAGSADVEVMSSSRRFRLVSVDVWWEVATRLHSGLAGCRCPDRPVGCGGERCELEDSC